MESWKSVKHRDGNSFRCFYAKSKRRSEASSFNKPKEQNMSSYALKNMIDCPFRIHWSIPGVKNKSVPIKFRKVFITKYDSNHNC